MTFYEFQTTFAHLPVISVIEIEKLFPNYDRNALTRWQKKGYLIKIRSGYYRLTNQAINGDLDLFFIANQIYSPSYISLESALRWYDFIPEAVFLVTSLSTRKTQTFETSIGHFSYRSIRPELFFGYRLEKYSKFSIKIAEPAKAILDLLYLNPHLTAEDDFFEMRLNYWELEEKLDLKAYHKYITLYSSRSLEIRAKNFLKFIKNHAFSN